MGGKKRTQPFARECEDFITPWYTYLARIFMVPVGAAILYFIYWRWRFRPESGIWWQDALAYVFITCETICYLFCFTQWIWGWNLKYRKQMLRGEVGLLDDEDLPTIDIMIPCYSEPTEIVEMTLRACYKMDYPAHKVTCWICDDGGKADMCEMTKQVSQWQGGMQTKYVARVKTPGVPHHAKAGNLNNVILNEGSTGQLIMILDCDMLPEKNMALTVAPFFYKRTAALEREAAAAKVAAAAAAKKSKKAGKAKPAATTDVESGTAPFSTVQIGRAKGPVFDEKVGLLQTPQAFYNLDSHDLLGQNYTVFYEIIMSGWDGSGCTPCCGTGVTFSRSALESVGGFSTGSITEDFMTSLNLTAHGFQCKYFLQRMTRGVNPKELDAFMQQRLRWAVGAIQILRKRNPLFVKNLHIRARLLYFMTTIGTVLLLPLITMLLIIYISILANVNISFGPKSFTDYLIIGGPPSVGSLLLQKLLCARVSRRDFQRALQDNFTCMVTALRANLIGFFGVKLGFKVTDKDTNFDLVANLKHSAPHFILYAISIAAMAKCLLELAATGGYVKLPYTANIQTTNVLFTLMWTIFLWGMISQPPRMFFYAWQRAKLEKLRGNGLTAVDHVALNPRVPALQELLNTPLSTFPTTQFWVSTNGSPDRTSAKS